MKIAIAGAGSIGCFVGGVLAHKGHEVQFLARPRVIAEVAQAGLILTDFAGLELRPANISMSQELTRMSEAEVILVTTKTGDCAEMARLIAAHAAPDALVISLQNGIEAAQILRAQLGADRVRAAMVPFNVVHLGPGRYHRATSGDIQVAAGVPAALDAPELRWSETENIEAIQWGKLLINLGNALNALSDLPLLEQLHMRPWRRLIADQMAEALGVLRTSGIHPAKTTAAPPRLIPFILRLPTPIFRRVAAQMLTIDPTARSSMWEDLKRGRRTEIDALQGAIIALAQKSGQTAPINTRVRALVKAAEQAGAGPPGLSAQQARGEAPCSEPD